MQGLTALEKVGHQYHMHEIYQKAAVIYKELVANPPTDKNLCPCVNDVESNNILKELKKIFDVLRKFNEKGLCNARKKWFRRYKLRFSYEKESAAALNEIRNCKPVQGIQEEGWRPGNLRGPKNWVLFASMLEQSMISEEKINDLAVFLYCKLNEPTNY